MTGATDVATPRGVEPGGAAPRGPRHGRWLRLLAGGLLFALLAGPTPGAVGSCSGDDPGSEPADFDAYCELRGQLVCARRRERGEIGRDDSFACRRQAIELCGQRAFAANCSPTKREADACLNALQSLSTLDEEVDELPECRDLCGLPSEDQAAPRSISDDDAGTEGA